MSRYLPVGTCLQCEQTREEVRREGTICGIEDGYEYRELVAEWPRHHWRDWSDAELRDISEHRRALLRRAPTGEVKWAEIESICDREGHRTPPVEDADELWCPPGRCVRCFADTEEAA